MTFALRRGLLASAAMGDRPKYLLRDEFVTARSVGAVNGTASEPGPGTRTVVDTKNGLTIANDKLVFGATFVSKAYGDAGLWLDAQIRRAGLALYCRLLTASFAGVWTIGWDSDQTSTASSSALAFLAAGTGQIFDTAGGSVALGETIWAQSTLIDVAVLLRAAGAFYFIKTATDTQWRLLWVSNLTTTTPVYPALQQYDGNPQVHYVRVRQLVGQYAAVTGLATAAAAAPTTGATLAQTADAIVELTWGVSPNQAVDLMFRRTDDDNCWIVRCDQAAGTIKLYDKQDGIETEHDVGKTYAFSQYQYHRITVRMYGEAIYVYVGRPGAVTEEVKSVELAAAFNKTATGVKIVGTGAFKNLIAWPGYMRLPFDLPDSTGTFLPVGDSKTGGVPTASWPPYLIPNLNTATEKRWSEITRIAGGGWTVATCLADLSAYLDATEGTPDYALINFGANDVGSLPAKATWVANYIAICDALREKWSAVQVYLMRPWRRNYATECDTVADWIDEIVATRTWVHIGPDERVFLENGDDGATYTVDGIHPNAAGYALTAAQWQTVMGL